MNSLESKFLIDQVAVDIKQHKVIQFFTGMLILSMSTEPVQIRESFLALDALILYSVATTVQSMLHIGILSAEFSFTRVTLLSWHDALSLAQ